MKEQKEQLSPSSCAIGKEEKIEQGYGACSASGCNCQGYAGSGDTCSNCGHNYQTHW
jgi:hypothetical protein